MAHPELGPVKLATGNHQANGRKCLSEIDDSFLDQKKVARERRKILEKKAYRASSIRGSMGAMVDFLSGIDEEQLVVKNTIHIRGARVLVLQTKSMKEVLQAGEPLQADS